jgi:hypothetical protein
VPLLVVMQKKLREVHYFLRQMGNVAHREVRDPEEFEFLLSAVLSAGRSITDHLDDRPYRTWFEAWRSSRTAREQELLEFMRVQRNAEVHRDGADVDLTVRLVPATEIPYRGRGHPAYYGFHWAAPPGFPPPTIGVKVHEFELGGTRVEACDACRAFAILLGELLTAFEVAHPRA